MLSILKKYLCGHDYKVLYHREQKSPFQEMIEKDPNIKIDDVKPWLFQAHVTVALKCEKCGHLNIINH